MKEKPQEMSRKILVYCAGLLVMAMGVSFSGKADLGISMALIALAISLACFGQFHGIREGTLIAAFGVGRILGLYQPLRPALRRFLRPGRLPTAE